MCERATIIDRGHVIWNGPNGGRMAGADQKDLVLRLAEPLQERPEALTELDTRLSDRSELVVQFWPTGVLNPDPLNRIREAGREWRTSSPQELSLEDLSSA